MTTLTARTLLTAVGLIAYPVIEIDSDGLIAEITSDPTRVGQEERTLAPAFFDIHIHGSAGVDVMQVSAAEFARMQRFLAGCGTAAFLPTTVTAPLDDTLRSLERLADAMEQPPAADGARPVGLHLEGPFLAHARRGVHPSNLLQRPSIPLFERFQQAARGHIRLLTLAPERPGALELIRHAVASGVRVSLGHTDATAAESLAAIAAGATSATHVFNAMRPLDHREPGVLGTVLDRQDLYAELIADGIHVDPAMVRLWLRLKGDHAILVTDGISATGMPEGAYRLGSLAVTVHAGRCSLTDAPETLAGSVLTLDRAVENLQRFTGCALEVAVRCASSQPARMLGLEGTVASLRPGQPANFNLYTEEGRLERTYLYGQAIARP